MAIYETTQRLKVLEEQYGRIWQELLRSGWSTDPMTGLPWFDPTDVPGDVAQWIIYELSVLSTEILGTKTQLDLLAAQYRAAGCFDEANDDPAVAPGGGPGDGGSMNCREEWALIEISYDGGTTWEPLYFGWVTVCE